MTNHSYLYKYYNFITIKNNAFLNIYVTHEYP